MLPGQFDAIMKKFETFFLFIRLGKFTPALVRTFLHYKFVYRELDLLRTHHHFQYTNGKNVILIVKHS
jgi:hypothetical protein